MENQRRDVILTACARTCICYGPRAWKNTELLQSFWSGPGLVPTLSQMRYLKVNRREIVAKIRSGIPDEDWKPWTGGFWTGLRLSRAIRCWSKREWVISKYHPALLEDLERLPMFGKIRFSTGIYYAIRSCDAVNLGTKDRYGVDVLAGLFAGSRLGTTDARYYYSYLIIPDTIEVKQLLSYWGIPIERKVRGGLGVSPFFAALLMGHLPMAVASRVLSIRKAVQCPLLPLVYWEVLYGSKGGAIPDFAGALPFACSNVTRKRHHWHHRMLHQKAVEMGIAHIPIHMKNLIAEWRESCIIYRNNISRGLYPQRGFSQ